MTACEEFERELQEALARLYDPDYQPSELLCALLSCEPQDALAVQSAIIRVIESLRPAPDLPPGARMKRICDLLYNRFVLKLTQEETAERLNVGISSAWRIQREAVHTLARLIWERNLRREEPASKRAEGNTEQAAASLQAADWHAQTQRELASLQANYPDAVSDVGEVIGSMLELEESLAPRGDVRVEVGFVQPGLMAALHPSVLLQMLIAAVRRLAKYASPAKITIFAGLENGNVRITITGTVAAESRPADSDLVRDILAPAGASVQAHVDGVHVFLWLELPSEGRITVLAVDDNVDMARFYQRATDGTAYHVVHTAKGQGLFETIQSIVPDILVLDVMLPDIDGWRLLMRLHQNPLTRFIPVIVCTVVRDEDLAMSLGATLYLPKPVRASEFILALDRVLPLARAEAPRSPASSAAAC